MSYSLFPVLRGEGQCARDQREPVFARTLPLSPTLSPITVRGSKTGANDSVRNGNRAIRSAQCGRSEYDARRWHRRARAARLRATDDAVAGKAGAEPNR